MKIFKSLLAVLSLAFVFSTAVFAQQNVSLPGLNGQTVSLTNQKGKVVVLSVGASWLPLSTNQAAITAELAKRYAGKDVALYFVATDSTAAKSKNYASNDEIQAFAAKNKINIPILRDSDGTVTTKTYKADQIPSFIIIDKNGEIFGEPFGGVTPNAKSEKDLTNLISQKIDGLL